MMRKKVLGTVGRQQALQASGIGSSSLSHQARETALLICSQKQKKHTKKNTPKDHEKLIEYGRLKVFTVQSKSAATTTGESAHPFPSYVLLSKKKQQSIKKVEAQTTAAPSFYDHRFSLSS